MEEGKEGGIKKRRNKKSQEGVKKVFGRAWEEKKVKNNRRAKKSIWERVKKNYIMQFIHAFMHSFIYSFILTRIFPRICKSIRPDDASPTHIISEILYIEQSVLC